MATLETGDVTVAARISKELHAKILRRQREVKRLTGIEPSVSAIVRAMIAEASEDKSAKRRQRVAA